MASKIDNSKNIHSLLKEATASAHIRIENLNPLSCEKPSIENYIKFITLTYQIIEPIEEQLKNNKKLGLILIDFNSRMRTASLISDLKKLKVDISKIPKNINLPEINSLSQAFGVLYVLEGSTLGGMVLCKKLSAIHGDKLEGAMNYLIGRGNLAFKMWKDFLIILNEYSKNNDAENNIIAHSACETFQCFETLFSSNS
jgi:heme oxygenase